MQPVRGALIGLMLLTLVVGTVFVGPRSAKPSFLAAQGWPVQVVAKSMSGVTAMEDALLSVLKAEFQKTNPRIDRVGIIELRGFPEPEARKYVVVGWGVRKDRTFSGEFSDELYGFFVVDRSLRRIEKVLKVVPTPRWLDYSFRIARVTADAIVITGQGATYGDQPLKYRFSWNPNE